LGKVDPERVRELYNQGFSDYKIAKMLGVSAWTARYYRIRLGLPVRYIRGKPRKIDLEKLKQLYAQGCSYEEIARQLNTTKKVVALYVSKLGIANKIAPFIQRIERIKEAAICIAEKEGFVTIEELKKNFNASKSTVLKAIYELEGIGKLKRFNLNLRNKGIKYKRTVFFKALPPNARFLFYTNEEGFIIALAAFVDLDVYDTTAKKAFTRLLRRNNISEAGIKLFYTIKHLSKALVVMVGRHI
jgi:DNA-binding Lrp family transcriptional regulator/DNA-binding CsgD family transcriptional regulator